MYGRLLVEVTIKQTTMMPDKGIVWWLLLLAVAVILQRKHVVAGVDFTSSFVFNPTFYINTYPDLHIFKTVAEARRHWLRHGIGEGRQACGSFHSKQYLNRYADLRKAFGRNYRKAVEHYLTYGVSEKRLGYLGGGAEGRWTVSSPDHSVVLSGSKRMGGAIDSLVWNRKEFFNSWDHGRGMQIAVNTHPYGACFAIKEAGSRADGEGLSTTSQLVNLKFYGNKLSTTTHPAFLIHPGSSNSQPISCACEVNSPTLNTDTVYRHDFSKTVTVGCFGMNNCIKFASNITIAGHWPDAYKGINFEAPTGYMASDFSSLNNYDFVTNKIYEYSNNRKPVILQTADGHYAMGVFAPSGQDSDSFQYYSASSFGRSFASGTNKWGVVFRKTPFPAGSKHVLSYTTYLCVGTRDMVQTCLDHLHERFLSSTE